MPITTIANLRIDKLKEDGFVSFVTLELEQFIADHARVKIKIDLETFGEDVFSNPMERIALINERIYIDVQTIGEDEKTTDVYGFLGLITDVQVELDAGQHGWMYIYAASRSIELERGNFLKTHTDMKLKDIVARVIKDKVYVMVANDPEYDSKIPFSMQYYETDYQYVRRLAWMYGEKFFFNGNNIIFGRIAREKTTRVTYNKELTEIKLNSRLISNRFKQYYHNLKDEKSVAIEDIDQKDTFTAISGSQSNKLNQKNHMPEIPIATPVYDDGSLKKLTGIRKKATMNQMFEVTGKTNEYKITIGELLEIAFDKKMTVNESLGTLRVTRTLHMFDQNKRYYNEFTACQKAYDYFPYKEAEMPIAQTLTATVFNNQDPEGLGRTQLVFDFEDELCQHWFKTATPDGGGNKHIGKEQNRGMIFVKEIGDRVLVDFIEGNPDKPYISGSLFHGNNAKGLGGGEGNHIRSISDKANNYIQWNSAAGIRTQDKNGNYIHLDGGGNVNIRSSETIVLRCGKDGEGSGIMLTKDGLIHILGNHIIIDAKDNTQSAVGAAPQPLSILINANPEVSMSLAPDAGNNGESSNKPPQVSVDITEAKIDINSLSSINANSSTIHIEGSTKTQVNGGGGKLREENGEVHLN